MPRLVNIQHHHIHHHSHTGEGGNTVDLAEIHRKLDTLLTQGVRLMAQNAELLAFLSQLNTYTNEIAADIDKLIADSDLSPEVRAAMQAHSDTLKALAAKSGDPLPPPVEPPPV